MQLTSDELYELDDIIFVGSKTATSTKILDSLVQGNYLRITGTEFAFNGKINTYIPTDLGQKTLSDQLKAV